MPVHTRVLRLVSAEPVHGALLECRRRDWPATVSLSGLGSATEAMDAVRHLAAQLLALSADGTGGARSGAFSR